MSPQPGADSLPFFLPETAGKPDFRLELMLQSRGRQCIAGIDEAGRGPLAGPVVAAAVVLDPRALPAGLDDSKKLSRSAREQFFEKIVRSAQVSWCAMPSAEIDRANILQATFAAMARAAAMLPACLDACLIDGRDVPIALRATGIALIGGDRRSASVAAASIVAKVVRDAMMEKAAELWPGYGFERHKGYGTKAHFAALDALGPCPLHRRSFAPVALACEKQGIK